MENIRALNSDKEPSTSPFAITPETDYIALGHHVALLSWALTDIPAYTARERALGGEGQCFRLEEIERQLTRINERIRELLCGRAVWAEADRRLS